MRCAERLYICIVNIESVKWLIVWCGILFSFSGKAQQQFRVAEFNVENLFDCNHDEGKRDEEFLPQSERCWTWGRYWKKQKFLSKALIALGGSQPADLIALCEVENDTVLRDLTQRSPLRVAGYHYLMTESRDERGMDVALLYQPATFKPLMTNTIRVKPVPNQRITRDVLHVTGRLQTGDTLDVFVCHLPSKKGGREAADYRLRVTSAIRVAVDSVMQLRCVPQLIVTGDFNDTYKDKSVRKGLKALPFDGGIPKERELYVLSTKLRGKHVGISGTYYYQQRWEQLDQFIVNGRLLRTDNGIYTKADACKIADYPFLLARNALNEWVPWRTYLGPVYKGGYSDHLPLVTAFHYSW